MRYKYASETPIPWTNLDLIAQAQDTTRKRMSSDNLGIPGRDRAREMRANGVTFKPDPKPLTLSEIAKWSCNS